MKSQSRTWSWGRLPCASHHELFVDWSTDGLPVSDEGHTLLPYGCGRSYGDVPINHDNSIIRTSNLNRILEFDVETGVLRCEAGATFSDLLKVIVPKGWFFPVTPGTQFITLGGAVANDVHGKNHHAFGTFGSHVLSLDLLRSDSGLCRCTPDVNTAVFNSTIGGLGLTGLIVSVDIQLMKIASSNVDCNNIVFSNLTEGLSLLARHESEYMYSVAWIDCLAKGNHLGRGILTLANHSNDGYLVYPTKRKLLIPVDFPSFTLNKYSVGAFNSLYYWKACRRPGRYKIDYESYFYPLDSILQWNKIYGKKGFYQYQFVVPHDQLAASNSAIEDILLRVADAGSASFLTVLKTFGNMVSPGILSFPQEGVTLAMDISNTGDKSLQLLEDLDKVVISAGGRVYPAKDARMSANSFKEYFPAWEEFSKFVDPKFSSSFWRRVEGDN